MLTEKRDDFKCVCNCCFSSRTIPVIIIKPAINAETIIIELAKQNKEDSSKFTMTLQICFNTPKGDIKGKYSYPNLNGSA